jgi:DNA topoisomerase-1
MKNDQTKPHEPWQEILQSFAVKRRRDRMKYCMKSLKHNGICIPPYELKGLSVKIDGQTVRLSPATEQMAIAWARKKLSVTSPPDNLFYKNFVQDFLRVLERENSFQKLLSESITDYVRGLNNNDNQSIADGKLEDDPRIDFSDVTGYVVQEQQRKLNMLKEEKKRIASERKKQREDLREIYGYALVDGRKLEIANWTAEPSCIFAGRGNHPRRGKWKEGPKQEDIVLNLSPDSPRPPGNWKNIMWEPDKMYIAKWEDKLCGKMKYVWFSDSAFLKQKMEQEKFKKAQKLDKKIPEIEQHIMKNLNSKDLTRRKIATICWLILKVNIRVGDEKDPGEADTVGAITLRPEHIKIEDNVLDFDFLGKDCVRWVKQVEASPVVVANIAEFSKECKEYLFEGVNSRKVSRFLFEKMNGLTAKVFRTWRCTKTVEKSLEGCKTTKEDPDYVKQFCAKKANLEAAIIANHKRKIPQNFEDRVAKKAARLKELQEKLLQKKKEGKRLDAITKSVEKTSLDLKLMKETKEYNLGTSLKSYIDPLAYIRWASKMNFPLEKFYPKTLRKKFSWALDKACRPR